MGEPKFGRTDGRRDHAGAFEDGGYPGPAESARPDPFSAEEPEPETAFNRFARETLSSTSREPDPRHREPTPDEEEEMDRYYQRKSWLE